MTDERQTIYDVIIIGGGQSALSVAYYLRRTTLKYIMLDAAPLPGGSWQYTWKSLSLFSPAQWSSLPGVFMPGGQHHYPSRAETITYLQEYELRYKFPVARPVKVTSVVKKEDTFVLTTTAGYYYAKAIVSATGSYANPFIPDIPGSASFKGTVLHSSQYREPEDFSGKRVAIVGEGNSGAQILAEVSKVASALWITRQPPEFLPDDIDGKYLFDAATQLYQAKQQGRDYQPPSLGHIVMVPPVKEARERGVYQHFLPAFDHFYPDGIAWNTGQQEAVDAVIFCTGFRPALAHLAPLGIIQPDGRIKTNGTKATGITGLWLTGYGSWTGFASATLIGVGRTAKQTVEELSSFLQPA
ncbi:Predicted flavoprotein CzcO associated with the cation diffusion facilitator CzcD [Chitinophaga ginsengisegetis]|uniref:Predicted flavoprotein CzcO associated with the cation diffusion facilitator CzcD n=1 Tax=Chitinophaga ginsengisegetis TaxID=393003 RepID=A0A1T5NLG5_9BACT|nr:ArsO family NAD(P)H-dependent flavin-containing monooxygenase [Chitinophaga ginsengisegetis]SKD00988.1 Predicted flavoprotein CzcO associated with the cation diffusion facilitator CzcD [Chitinophaga ginsengisegetis]